MKIFDTITIAVVLLFFGLGVNESYATNADETLRGEVTEATTGEPVPGATIMIRETERGTAADSNGRFEFTNLLAGSYTLTVRAVGFIPVNRSIDHPGDGSITVELRQDVFQANDVIVTSSPIGRNI